MIREIKASNILSFGPNAEPLALQPLNLLIGPNGSGKSNLLELMGLLHRLPRKGSIPVVDWLWKGAGVDAVGRVEVVVDGVGNGSGELLRHWIEFESRGQRFGVRAEEVEGVEGPGGHSDGALPRDFYRNQGGAATIMEFGEKSPASRDLDWDDLDLEQSVLSQIRDPRAFPQLRHLADLFDSIALYRDVNFGPNSRTRLPQKTDLANKHLDENGGNLALILNKLQSDARTGQLLRENLKLFYEPADDVHVQVEGGTAQIFVHEGEWTTPAARLSDGTMRWLSLLAILLNPKPPAVICLDEPDLGLHPDILPTLASLLVEASQRSQLIVTTHSETLVDALGDRPGCVLVCEKVDNQTTLRRLDEANLSAWLSEYSLGRLWRSGEIGGNRW